MRLLTMLVFWGGIGLSFGIISLSAAAIDAPPAVAPANSTTAGDLNGEKAIDRLRTEVAELKTKVEKPPKDAWDKLTAVSGLASGLAVALIGFYATNVYNRRQRIAEDRRKDQEVIVSQLQTVEKFIPHLSSTNEQIKGGALIAISALGNDELAIKLAKAFGGAGATSALTTIATTANLEAITASAQHVLLDIFKYLQDRVVAVHDESGPTGRRASGFIVDAHHRLIVTAAHVLNLIGPGGPMIGLPGDILVPATVVRRDESSDLVLLSAATDQALLPLDPTPSRLVGGEPITALLIGLRGERRIAFGSVIGMEVETTGQGGRRKIAVSLSVEPGASGAPVVDKEGHLLGIIQATDTRRAATLLIPAEEIFAFVNEARAALLLQNS